MNRKIAGLALSVSRKSPWQLALFSIDGGKPTQTFDIAQTVDSPMVMRWTADGRAITYIDTRNGVSNLCPQPISGGAPKHSPTGQPAGLRLRVVTRKQNLAVSRGTRNDEIV